MNRKNNGIKILGGSAAALFLAVFVLSRFSWGRDSDISAQSVNKDSRPSASQSAENEKTDTQTQPVVTEPAVKTPVKDPAAADNTWAMFLVNAANKLPDGYDTAISTELVYESWKEFYMDSRVAEYMKNMINAASADGVNLTVVSAYRSAEYQQKNFDNSVQERVDERGMTYEEAYADTLKEVQLPGYSEHNAGVSADIMSDEYSDMDDDGFKNTKAYEWLMEHCADYGFILRYPEGKYEETGIIYEPWHYRFVGVYYAKKIMEEGVCLEEFFEEMNWVDEKGTAVYHLVDGSIPAETSSGDTAEE